MSNIFRVLFIRRDNNAYCASRWYLSIQEAEDKMIILKQYTDKILFIQIQQMMVTTIQAQQLVGKICGIDPGTMKMMKDSLIICL